LFISFQESLMAENTEPGINLTPGLQRSAPVPAAPVAAAQQVTVDDSKAQTCYANFARVTGTPEELIIDLGLNTEPFGVPTRPVKVDQRVVLGYHTAKRLMAALQMSLQRHEAAFGALELDVQRRIRSPQRNA
jgi:hypothetical protein